MNDGYHKLMYDSVRIDHPHIPAWEDLSEAQKQKMREANDEYTKFMNELGKKIRGQHPLEP